MAKIGRPVLIGVQTVETLRHRLDLYRETMHDAKYSDSQVEHALDETWVQRGLVVAESDQEAQDIAGPALERYRKHLLDARINYNISEVPAVDPSQPRPPGEVVEQAFLAGTPSRVAEVVDELKDIGARNGMLKVTKVGSTVIVQENNSDKESFVIVGAAEADPSEGLISNESPLGQALLGSKAGDKVVVTAPSGDTTFYVTKVK